MQIFTRVNFEVLFQIQKLKNKKKKCDLNIKYVFMNNHFPELMLH